ncbi:unnamed protein product [Prorocentrum cordatum]|uniref:PKD/REJ-like domain-containing protein n=1 Tax=Prorocentrum cordatum TaxID=2364126 RepID=A0ABN9RSL6_9DINO|nr:unnamed protein product [Polarella glacialis]
MEDGPVALSASSLPASPGTYQLRLVLSESEYPGFTEDASSNIFVYDSASFLIDEPPTGGSCQVFPSSGNATLTKFTLSSLNWLDDDLPLLHSFSKCIGASQRRTGGCDAWVTLSAYSQSQTMQNVLFSSTGTMTVRALAQDALGSSAEATTEVEVFELTQVINDDELLSVVTAVASFGDPFTTLAAVSAVAETSGGGNQEFSSALLDAMGNSGALADASTEAISASSTALASIVSAASTVSTASDGSETTAAPTAVVVQMEVAEKAATVVTSIASAAAGLDEGMQADTATVLMSSVATLLNTATAAIADNGTAAAGGNSTSAQAQKQKGLSGQLQQAAEAIGDAVIQAASAGETVTLNTSSGLELSVQKADSDQLAAGGVSMGGFTLPPMPELAASRRLQAGRRLPGGAGIGLQQAKWPSNPFSYAGSAASTTSSSGQAVDTTIPFDGVRSFTIRQGGEEVAVSGLVQPITMLLPLSGGRRLSQSQDTVVEEVHECMFFNHTQDAWSSEGCWLVEVNDDSITCNCTHLSFFSSAVGFVTSALGDFLCPNVAILAPAGFANLGKGQWAMQRGGIVLWTLLAIHLAITLLAAWRQGSWKTKPNFFLYQDDFRSYKKITVLSKMMEAGKKSGKSRWKVMVVFASHAGLRLKLNYDYEELFQKDTIEIVRTLVFYKLMMMWVTASMGFSEVDLRYLRHGNVLAREQPEGDGRKKKLLVRAARAQDEYGSNKDDDNGGSQSASHWLPTESRTSTESTRAAWATRQAARSHSIGCM